MDLQRGGASQFRVDRTGYGFFSAGLSQVPEIGLSSSGILLFAGRIRIKSATSSTVMFQDSTELSSANIILGLQTNLFPMIKRNGAALQARLADDSGYCNFDASTVGVYGNLQLQDQITTIGATDIRIVVPTSTKGLLINQDYSFTAHASALVEVRSTTKGFLPPKMTTTQKNAISSPATGLVVFDIDLGKLCVYSGTWQTVTSI
jgi:hypothetical protein